MKSYVCTVLISAAAVAVSASSATVTQNNAAPTASMSEAQMDALVKTDVSSCASNVPVVPLDNVKTFPTDRLARTLHGIWKGRVSGDYPKELLAEDGYLNVDYYWIIDTERGEALILEQLSSKRAASDSAAANAPAWSFLTCGREGYVPQHPKQVHEFQKISDNLDDARRMLQTSTGLSLADQELSLSAAWQKLVDTKYFDTKRYGAYAGGLFKPFEIRQSTSAAGTPVLSLSYHAEYRGAGQTAATFETGVPILGRESAGFIGVSTPSGDYLVSSLGNGVEWEKVEEMAALINMTMDKVVIGPLAAQ